MKRLVVIGCLFGVILRLHSQGFIVPNGVTSVGFDGLGYQIRVLQHPTSGNYTGFTLIPQGKTPPTTLYTNTFSFDGYVDEQVRVFLVSLNQPISLPAILSQNYTELGTGPSYQFNSGSSFYVGLYTGNIFPQNGIYEDPLFGWARLVNNQGVIQLLDGALAYQAGGIYAGTQNLIPVPEPGGLALAALGALLLGLRRWRAGR